MGSREPNRTRYRNDPALVQACIEGDEQAWVELVERYGRLVYSIARRSGLSLADADDAVQNTFLLALRHLHALRDQTRLSSWLITTASRESWRLSRQRAFSAELDEAASYPETVPVDEILRWEREHQVREALRRVDERCHELLTALFLDPSEPTYEAIAARLGMPIGSIGPTRARCFRKLERALLEVGFEV